MADGGGAGEGGGPSAAEAAFVAPGSVQTKEATQLPAQTGVAEATQAGTDATGIGASIDGNSTNGLGTVIGEASTVLADAADAATPVLTGVTRLDAALAAGNARVAAEAAGVQPPDSVAEGASEGDEPPVVPNTGEAARSDAAKEATPLSPEDEAAFQAERKKIIEARAIALRAEQKDLLEDVEALRGQDLTREAILALAVDSDLNWTALKPILKKLREKMEVKSFEGRSLLGKITGILTFPLAPVDRFGRAMVQRSINESGQASQKQDALIQEQGRAVINILSHGTPEMQALALDAQIPTELQRLADIPEGAEHTALKAKIAAMRSERSKLKLEDGSEIPNKFVEIAQDFAGLLEEGGVVPDGVRGHEANYVQNKLLEVVGDKKARERLFKGLEAAGKISKDDRKELTSVLTLPEKGPTVQKMKFLAKVLSMGGGLALVALYFRLKQESAQAAGGGGGGRRGH